MRINVKSSTVVKPMAETPSCSLWLSSLDLLMPDSFHLRTLYVYRSNGAANFFDPTALKAALSRALVEFYPFAGRLKRDHNNRIEINCNGEGVLFVEAESDATVDDFGDFIPKRELGLIPAVDYSKGISTYPLVLLQLTRLRCGGVCLGVANEHHLTDGVSALHFINTWSNIARGQTDIAIPPFFDRTILSARDPPQPKFVHIEFQPVPQLKTPLLHYSAEATLSIFKLTRDQLSALKAKCKEDEGENRMNYSSYEVVTGHVWRCVCMARGLPPDQESRLHIPTDGRNRLQPPLPRGYSGNVIFPAAPIARCGELGSNPLNFTVHKVHEAIARMDDDYLRSALDYLELKGDVSAVALSPLTRKCPNFGLTSWVQLPFYDADFGWGKPVYVGPWIDTTDGQSFLLPSPTNDGSLLLAITQLKEHMNLFEKLLYDI